MTKELLDPIGTMCRLISLNFKDEGTKFSIHDHVISLQLPTHYQPILRLAFGDGKENVSELYNAMNRLIRWYIIPSLKKETYLSNELVIYNEDKSHDINNEYDNAYLISCSSSFKRLVKYLCISFSQLQKTYFTGNVVLALQFYINILNNALNGQFADDLLPTHIEVSDDDPNSFNDYNKMKNIWEVKKVELICEQYDNCFNVMNDVKASKESRDSFIDAYLDSVDRILNQTDKKFKQILENSRRG